MRKLKKHKILKDRETNLRLALRNKEITIIKVQWAKSQFMIRSMKNLMILS